MATLEAITSRLETTPKLSKSRARELSRANTAKLIDQVLAGESYGRASKGLALLNQPEADFRAELRATDGDLGVQVDRVDELLDAWFGRGELPPPYYAWRIAVILSKAKRKDEEGRFLAAWCRHFGDVVGGRFTALRERAFKLGVIAP